MRFILFKALLVLLLFTTGCATKQQSGSFLGAGFGGLVGSQFGGGKGQVAATTLGTAVGMYMGSEIGASLDRADQAYANQAMQRALNSRKRATWFNPSSGMSGEYNPQSTYFVAHRECATYTYVYYPRNGPPQHGSGESCTK